MKRILLAFSILLIAMIAGVQLNKDPGYVLIALNHWTVETTLWFLVLALILIFLLLHLTLQILHFIGRAPQKFKRWRAKRQAQKAQEITRKGLIEYTKGYWHQAKNHLVQALPNTDTPLLNYLTAARAAQKMGDSTLRDNFLREAQQSMPEAKVAVELTQAQLQLANQQWEQALATLQHLRDIAPRHPYVLKLLMQLYQQIKDWPRLIQLLPDLKKYQVMTPLEFNELQQNVYKKELLNLIRLKQPVNVHHFYQSLPKNIKGNRLILAEYIRFLIDQRELTQAEQLLRNSLKKDFHPELIKLYGLLPGDEKKLHFVESLLKKYPDSADLLVCLGKLCLNLQLWGKAKYYLEQANHIQPTPQAYAILGKLHEKLGDPVLAAASYKHGLELIVVPSVAIDK